MTNERDYYKEALEIIHQVRDERPSRDHLIALYDHIILMQTSAQLTKELITQMKQVFADRRNLLGSI